MYRFKIYKLSIRQANVTSIEQEIYQALGFPYFDLLQKGTPSIQLLFIN